MLKLSDIMTPEVVTVTPETTLREAVELLTEKHIGGVPVVSGRQVVGVVSASDILEFAVSVAVRSEATDDRSWADESTDEETERADSLLGSYYTDLFSGERTDVVDRISGSVDSAALDAHTVDEVMTRDPIMLSPHDSVTAAADLMRGRSIHRVLVVQHGELVGIVSTLDLACAIAEHKLTTRTYVFERKQ